jgi:hypothetical protein
MGCGSGPGPELGARVAERGRAVHEQGKSQREREREREGEVAIGWDRLDGGTHWQGEQGESADPWPAGFN